MGIRAAFLDARRVPATARFVPDDHHLGLGQQHRMGRVAYALREPNSARRPNAYPSGCHEASQHIPIAGQLGISRRPKSTPFSAADANGAGRRRRVGAGETAARQNDDPASALAHRGGACSTRVGTYRPRNRPKPTASTAASSTGCCGSRCWRRTSSRRSLRDGGRRGWCWRS
jgi:hypothetical protein